MLLFYYLDFIIKLWIVLNLGKLKGVFKYIGLKKNLVVVNLFCKVDNLLCLKKSLILI